MKKFKLGISLIAVVLAITTSSYTYVSSLTTDKWEFIGSSTNDILDPGQYVKNESAPTTGCVSASDLPCYINVPEGYGEEDLAQFFSDENIDTNNEVLALAPFQKDE